MDAYKVVRNPLSTEKGIRMMEAENKLVFEVEPSASKKDIKVAVEELFKVKVIGISTISRGGKKKAYVKLRPETPAIEVATQLGLM